MPEYSAGLTERMRCNLTPTWSRREFLSRSAANGLVWACGSVLTSCKEAPADQLRQKDSKDPNKAIVEKVKQIIVEQLRVTAAEVTPSARFKEDLGADSLDLVELVMAFEEAFETEIPDEDCEKFFITVKGATEYISSRVKTRPAPTHP